MQSEARSRRRCKGCCGGRFTRKDVIEEAKYGAKGSFYLGAFVGWCPLFDHSAHASRQSRFSPKGVKSGARFVHDKAESVIFGELLIQGHVTYSVFVAPAYFLVVS